MTKQLLLVEDFVLSITSHNSVLDLEAEENSSGKVFTASLDNDTIIQKTNGLFENAENMAEGLMEAANESCPELKLTIDSQGKLTYTAVFSAGKIKKEMAFTVDLTEKQLQLDEVFRGKSSDATLEAWKAGTELKFTNLEKTVQAFQCQNEEKFNKLENMINQMEQKMNQRFEEFYEILKAATNPQKNELLVSAKAFNPESINASYYDMTDGNRTIKLQTSTYPCIELLPEVPKKGQYTCSIKINSEINGICFGITTQRKERSWNGNNQCNYRYWTEDGGIYGRTMKACDNFGLFGGKGTTLRMLVDMDKGILTFFVNDKERNSCEIVTLDSYFAYVSLGNTGDSVTLL